MKDPKKPRYLINPFEVLIFFVVLSLTLGSFYRLFFDWDSAQYSSHNKSIQNEDSLGTISTASRGIASQRTPLFQNIEFSCPGSTDELSIKKTSAERVRIIGSYCNAKNERAPASNLKNILKVEVVNTANNSSATVFDELAHNKFTTDYIPLLKGKNKIEITHYYKNNKKITHHLILEKD